MAAKLCLAEGAAAAPNDWEPPQLTASQLHWLARHIKALAELSRQLRAVRDGGRIVGTEHIADLGFSPPAEPQQLTPRSRATRKPKPARKPKAAPKKRRREQIAEEPEAIEGSEDSDSEPEEAAQFDSDEETEPSEAEPEADAEVGTGADSEAEAPAERQNAKAGRRSGRHAAKPVRKAKRKLSDNESEDEFEGDEPDAEAGAASGPAQLVRLKATSYVPREQELCDVCGGGEGWDGNAILLCDGPGCAVALHQHCCGAAEIPEGEWLCDGCAAGVPPQAHMCLLCPVSGGALRRVGATGPVKLPPGMDASEGAWVHLACAIWTPEVFFEQTAELRGMRLDDLTAERMELLCGACKQGGGGMVQCCFGKCTRPLHILCARQHGHVVTLRAADAMLLCFCKLHSGDRFAKTRAQMIEEVPEGCEPVLELPDEAPPVGPNEYEAQRERNIARNKLRLAELRAT